MKILVIDDEQAVRELLADVLNMYGHVVVEARDGDEGIQIIDREDPFDMIFTDLLMPNASGDQVIRHVQEVSPATPTVLVSGTPFDDKAKLCRPDATMPKPYDIGKVEFVMDEAIKNRRLALTEQLI